MGGGHRLKTKKRGEGVGKIECGDKKKVRESI